MKIAIDVSPLQTEHKVRGVGFYLEHLKSALVKYHSENKYIFFVRGEKLPEDIDLIHFPYFEPFFLALPLYKKFKTVVTVHDLTPIVFNQNFPRGIKGEIKWQMQKFSLRKSNRIITDSNCSKNDIVKYVGINRDLIDVVYLAAGEKFKKMEIVPDGSFHSRSSTNEIRQENWKLEIMKRYKTLEICNECGRDVGWGNGLFINRIVDLDDYKTRKEMNKPFPKGDYICRECEIKIYN